MTPAVAVALLGAIAAAACGWLAWQAGRQWSLRQAQLARALAHDDLAASFVFVDPERIARASAWLLAAIPLLALLSGLHLAFLALAFVAWMLAPRMIRATLQSVRRRSLESQLPAAADALASQLRAGLGLSQALAVLAAHQRPPLAQELALLLRRHRLGVTLDAALEEWPKRLGSTDLVLFVSALRVSRELGSGLADALERLGDTLRRRRMLEDRIRALTAQGRFQGVVVSLLPVALLAVLAWLEPEATRQFFTTDKGIAALGVIIVLELVGWWLIRRIVNIDV
jgi:tight adherence protein B